MIEFQSTAQLRDACQTLPEGSQSAAAEAAERQAVLTKPQGSLGRLEDLAIWLARWQGRAMPRLNQVETIVFAGSHGIAAQGVSAFPPEVTQQMVANFAAGGAAINQLARAANSKLTVIPLQVEQPTADFTAQPAMTEDGFLAAVSAGYGAVSPDLDLLCLGEMGIGNTTAASAVAAALFGSGGAAWAGRGTGVDEAGLARKINLIDAGLARHRQHLDDPLAAIARLGGRELAAIFGAALAARHHGIPVLLDGFVCTAAAAPLARLHAQGLAHALIAHASAESGHRRLAEALGMAPLLDLSMRLGEASGACLAVSIVRAAVACHTGMASFAEAGVSREQDV